MQQDISFIPNNSVTTMDELQTYLEIRRDNTKRIYHYTSLENLIRILHHGRLMLNNIKNVNDRMEYEMAHTGHNIFLASFTNTSEECVHYWAVYGKGNLFSLRIGFECEHLCNPGLLRYCTDDGQTAAVSKAILSDVIYFKPARKTWRHNNFNFNNLKATESEVRNNFPGLCKYSIWEHEKETRLIVHSDAKEERIFIELDAAIIRSMNITFSPWLDKVVRTEISKMIINMVNEKYDIRMNNLMLRQSTIYNQIKPM